MNHTVELELQNLDYYRKQYGGDVDDIKYMMESLYTIIREQQRELDNQKREIESLRRGVYGDNR